jgi:hypothetical protein
MRVRGDLCAFGEIYARSGRFMLVRRDLNSLDERHLPQTTISYAIINKNITI